MGRQKRAYQSVTIRDVAERAGVAVSTVSRVLNGLDRVSEETRRRVEQAARELSYVPNNFAASMVTGQSKILGIIVPSFTHDFFGFIAQTAEHVFRKHGYLTIVSASGEDPVADPAAFLQRFYHMLDGVLLVPTAARLKDLESFDKPLLLVDRDMPGSSFSSISFDNEPACYELTRRLTEKGHRRIGLLVLNSPMNIGADPAGRLPARPARGRRGAGPRTGALLRGGCRGRLYPDAADDDHAGPANGHRVLQRGALHRRGARVYGPLPCPRP